MRKPFLSYFRTMKDHRINRKKRHPLENIIAIIANQSYVSLAWNVKVGN